MKHNNSNQEFSYGVGRVKLLPRQLRRDRIDPKTRIALILNCLCGYNQSEAYAIAFNFKGSHKSLAPISSRFFNSPEVREFAELFCRYYSDEIYCVNDRYLKF